MDGTIAQIPITQGLRIVGVGVGGVFVNLLLLMLLIKAVGLAFGKKPAPKGKTEKPTTTKEA